MLNTVRLLNTIRTIDCQESYRVKIFTCCETIAKYQRIRSLPSKIITLFFKYHGVYSIWEMKISFLSATQNCMFWFRYRLIFFVLLSMQKQIRLHVKNNLIRIPVYFFTALLITQRKKLSYRFWNVRHSILRWRMAIWSNFCTTLFLVISHQALIEMKSGFSSYN